MKKKLVVMQPTSQQRRKLNLLTLSTLAAIFTILLLITIPTVATAQRNTMTMPDKFITVYGQKIHYTLGSGPVVLSCFITLVAIYEASRKSLMQVFIIHVLRRYCASATHGKKRKNYYNKGSTRLPKSLCSSAVWIKVALRNTSKKYFGVKPRTFLRK